MTEYEKAVDRIRHMVTRLNRIMSYPQDHVATFGYIGNCGPNGENDSRRWYVFLPHPGRVGTSEDCLGGFSTGDLTGARRCAADLHVAIRMATHVIFQMDNRPIRSYQA